MRTQEELSHLSKQNLRRYTKHLHSDLDMTSIILKGHLFTEEILMDIIRLQCRDSRHLENIQLSFHHKLKLVQALFGSHIPNFKYPENIWPVLDSLNQLRNAMAHQIDSPKALIRLKSFFSSFEQLTRKKVGFNVSNISEIPVDDKELSFELISIVFSILGFLGCIHGIAYLNPPSLNNSGSLLILPDKIQ